MKQIELTAGVILAEQLFGRELGENPHLKKESTFIRNYQAEYHQATGKQESGNGKHFS